MQSQENFMAQQQKAVERMMEMNRRSMKTKEGHTMPPAPSFVRLNENKNTDLTERSKVEKKDTPAQFLNTSHEKNDFSLPLLNNLKIDRDTTLILGLLLILWSEKSDRYLLLALLYILL